MFSVLYFFFFNDTATTEIYTLSLHDALPILRRPGIGHRCLGQLLVLDHPAIVFGHHAGRCRADAVIGWTVMGPRSEEHTSELQSPCNLVCRLLLEKKKYNLMIACAVPCTSVVHLDLSFHYVFRSLFFFF